MTRPLYYKIREKTYRPIIAIQEKRVEGRRASTLRPLTPRIATPEHESAGLILYTDAATPTNTSSAVLSEPSTFLRLRKVPIAQTATSPLEWHAAFGETTIIYGVEMLAVVAFICDRGASMAGKSVSVYVDNNCALSALVKGAAKSDVLSNLVQIFVLCAEIRYRALARKGPLRRVIYPIFPREANTSPSRRKKSYGFRRSMRYSRS